MNALGCRSKISRGRLAAVAKALADAKVNIEAILAVTAGGKSMFSVMLSLLAGSQIGTWRGECSLRVFWKGSTRKQTALHNLM